MSAIIDAIIHMPSIMILAMTGLVLLLAIALMGDWLSRIRRQRRPKSPASLPSP